MNETLKARLGAYRNILLVSAQGGAGMSSSSKGAEREFFVSNFLSWSLQKNLRVTNGDVIDSYGSQSGQIDLVIEYSFMPSIPLSELGPRLIFAENVCAAVEIKSDISGQWDEARGTAQKIRSLKRRYGTYEDPLTGPDIEVIPIVAIGYRGWKTSELLEEKVNEGSVDAIFVIESGLFYGKWRDRVFKSSSPEGSLLCFIEFIHRLTNVLADCDLANYYLT